MCNSLYLIIYILAYILCYCIGLCIALSYGIEQTQCIFKMVLQYIVINDIHQNIQNSSVFEEANQNTCMQRYNYMYNSMYNYTYNYITCRFSKLLRLLFVIHRRENWEPTTSSRICSLHFPDGWENGPTRFAWNVGK